MASPQFPSRDTIPLICRNRQVQKNIHPIKMNFLIKDNEMFTLRTFSFDIMKKTIAYIPAID
jgi:hypothetical protein